MSSLKKIIGNNKGEKMNWYLDVIKKYAVFNGRARRKEYWMFFLFNLIIGIIITAIEITIGITNGLAGGIYGLALLLPGIGVTIRRLHDTEHSGWWILIMFVPLVGLYLLYLLIKDSDPEENQYGLNPKAESAA